MSAARPHDDRLAAVAVWRETPYFTDAERAALDLAEHATRLSDRPDPVSRRGPGGGRPPLRRKGPRRLGREHRHHELLQPHPGDHQADRRKLVNTDAETRRRRQTLFGEPGERFNDPIMRDRSHRDSPQPDQGSRGRPSRRDSDELGGGAPPARGWLAPDFRPLVLKGREVCGRSAMSCRC
jgi:hypothetical protein